MFLSILFFLRPPGTIVAKELNDMGKIVLYLAMSVDGYIADEQGGVGWLGGDGSEPGAPGSYPAFYETVDTIVMGWTTYHQIITELVWESGPPLLCGNTPAGARPGEHLLLEWKTHSPGGQAEDRAGGQYLDLRRCVCGWAAIERRPHR